MMVRQTQGTQSAQCRATRCWARLGVSLLLLMLALAGGGTVAAARSGPHSMPMAGSLVSFRTAAAPDDGCMVQLDLVIVLDGSYSIPVDEFNMNVRGFTRQAVSALALAPQGARVAIAQFSSQGEARLEIPLSGDAGAVLAAIDGMSQIRGETDIQEGIAIAQQELRANGRADVPWLMVVITDGQDNEPGDLATEAGNARAAGTLIFAVGIGSEVDPVQMASVASAPDFVFTVADFLALVGLVDQLKFAFCAPPAPPPVAAPPPMTGMGPTMQELPPARCNDATNSGGAGITTRTYDMAASSGTFTLSYNTYSIPDKIEVFHEGRMVFRTNGFVGESKDVSITFGPGSSSIITLVVTGNTDMSTVWDYVVRCPGSGPVTSAPPTTSTAPPVTTTGSASLTTDKTDYRIGDPVRICYTVPSAGPITLSDHLPDGRSQVLLSGNDDGRGDCIMGTVEPPTGRECFRLQYSAGGGGMRETCINVTGGTTTAAAPAAPAAPMQTTQMLAPARCNDATNSGGAGITTRTYDMGTRSGTFTFSYNTYSITDKIEISYEGRQVFATNGFVGESKEVSVNFGPGNSTTITIVVTGNPTDTGTQWDYVVRCSGQGSTSAAAPPPPAPMTSSSGAASVTTDKRSYRVGESIRICYTVPGPGPITLTDITPDGRSAVLLRGNDDGRGDCISATVALPTGNECFKLDYQSSRGSGTAQTCITVTR